MIDCYELITGTETIKVDIFGEKVSVVVIRFQSGHLIYISRKMLRAILKDTKRKSLLKVRAKVSYPSSLTDIVGRKIHIGGILGEGLLLGGRLSSLGEFSKVDVREDLSF